MGSISPSKMERISRSSFYFTKPDEYAKTKEMLKEHGKSTPLGFVHDAQPIYWTSPGNKDRFEAKYNYRKVWVKNPFTGLFEPRG